MTYMAYISKNVLTYKQDLCILLYVIYNPPHPPQKKWRKGSRVPIKGRLERKLIWSRHQAITQQHALAWTG